MLCLLPIYALIGWLRLYEALNYWDYLIELNIWPRPLYFAITGAVIGARFHARLGLPAAEIEGERYL